MENELRAKPGKVTGYAVVRLNGLIVCDDPDNLPPDMWASLSPKDQEDLRNGRYTRIGSSHDAG